MVISVPMPELSVPPDTGYANLDEVKRMDAGGEEVTKVAESCPVCRTPSLELHQQRYFEGPLRHWRVGGSQDSKYLKIQTWKRCTNCGVDPEKIHPEVAEVLKSQG